MGQKKIKEDQLKGKLRLGGTVVGVVNGTGRCIIEMMKIQAMGLEIKIILAVYLRRSQMYSNGRVMKSRLLMLWGGGLGRIGVGSI